MKAFQPKTGVKFLKTWNRKKTRKRDFLFSPTRLFVVSQTLVRKTTHEASSSTTCHTNSILGWCARVRKMLRLFFGRYFYGIVYLEGCLLMPENRRNSFQLMTSILGRFQNKLKMTNPTTEKQQSGLCLFDAHTWVGFAFQRCSTPKRMRFWNNQSKLVRAKLYSC